MSTLDKTRISSSFPQQYTNQTMYISAIKAKTIKRITEMPSVAIKTPQVNDPNYSIEATASCLSSADK